MSASNTPELLAPVGDMQKLAVALAYGADAVYLSGKSLGMRAACKNFDGAELAEAVKTVHAAGKKVYVTLNIFPGDADLDSVDGYLEFLDSIAPDGVIVSDLGLISRVLKRTGIPVHVSTQANVLNSDTARFYADMGVKRIVLARELSLDAIRTVRRRTPDTLELEAFVHGAMCISYSGRCLLSSYFSGRSANRGECDQTCRMRFRLENGEEPVEFVEDDGTYIFGGNDLNMIEHLGELIQAGIASFKIEGRVKSEYYLGTVLNAYRHALDAAIRGEKMPPWCTDETAKAPNRGFNTGFYYGKPTHEAPPGSAYDFCAIVLSNDGRDSVVEMRNRFRTGEKLEILSPDNSFHNTVVTVPVMTDTEGCEVTDAKLVRCRLIIPGIALPPLSMLRRPPKRGI